MAGEKALVQLGGVDGGFAADMPQAQTSEDQKAVVEQYQQQNPDYEPFPEDAMFLVKGEALHDPSWTDEEPARMGRLPSKGEAGSQAEGAPKIPYLSIVLKEAREQGIAPSLVLAVIRKESGFDPKARNPSGATGLMQVLPSTARWLGLKDTSQLKAPAVNIKYGIKYFKYLHSEFGEGVNLTELSPGDIQCAGVQKTLAAYNAGPGNVRKYDGVPPFRETKNYVRLVAEYFSEYAGMNLGAGD
jgi:soluble lytic murein transglycosylase-like protein